MAFDGLGGAIAASQGTTPSGLNRNPEILPLISGSREKVRIRERKTAQIFCESSFPLKAALAKVEARQPRKRSASLQSLYQQRERAFSLALDAQVRPKVLEAAIRKKAVPCASENDGRPCHTLAELHHVSRLLKQEPRVGHVLVVDVSDGDPDGLRLKTFHGSRHSLFRLFLGHEVEALHLMPPVQGGLGHASEPQGKGR
jgi:hypothetical protein